MSFLKRISSFREPSMLNLTTEYRPSPIVRQIGNWKAPLLSSIKHERHIIAKTHYNYKQKPSPSSQSELEGVWVFFVNYKKNMCRKKPSLKCVTYYVEYDSNTSPLIDDYINMKADHHRTLILDRIREQALINFLIENDKYIRDIQDGYIFLDA